MARYTDFNDANLIIGGFERAGRGFADQHQLNLQEDERKRKEADRNRPLHPVMDKWLRKVMAGEATAEQAKEGALAELTGGGQPLGTVPPPSYAPAQPEQDQSLGVYARPEPEPESLGNTTTGTGAAIQRLLAPQPVAPAPAPAPAPAAARPQPTPQPRPAPPPVERPLTSRDVEDAQRLGIQAPRGLSVQDRLLIENNAAANRAALSREEDARKAEREEKRWAEARAMAQARIQNALRIAQMQDQRKAISHAEKLDATYWLKTVAVEETAAKIGAYLSTSGAKLSMDDPELKLAITALGDQVAAIKSMAPSLNSLAKDKTTLDALAISQQRADALWQAVQQRILDGSSGGGSASVTTQTPGQREVNIPLPPQPARQSVPGTRSTPPLPQIQQPQPASGQAPQTRPLPEGWVRVTNGKETRAIPKNRLPAAVADGYRLVEE